MADRYEHLLRTANLRRTQLAYATCVAHGIEPIVFKGWALERFFDQDSSRIYTDIDLAFSPELDRRYISGLIDSLRSVPLDIHIGLRKLELLTWEDLFCRSYLAELDGIPIRVLADEDNLRVTAVHWLTDGGVNKERLWDIFYLVKNRKEDFDWERCLESNGSVRKTWVMAAIATARDHLDLDVLGLPEDAQQFRLPMWYEKTLQKEWNRGVYPRRMLSTVITRPKFLLEQLHRRFPPNRIAATIDTETPIDDSSRTPAQVKSLANKILPFARGLVRRLTYPRRKHDR